MNPTKPPFAKRLTGWLDSFNPYDVAQLKGGDIAPLPLDDAKSSKMTSRLVVGFFLVFAGWAAFAPIDGGVVIQGSVVVQGARKALQHPQGGVVDALFVKEGDHVRQGDTLIRINPLTSKANLEAAEQEYISALAALSRLLAERDAKPVISWLADLETFGTDPRAESARISQQHLFDARRTEFSSQQSVLRQQIAGLSAQLRGQEESVVARRKQIELIEDEVRSNRALASEGHVPKSKVSELERTLADATVSITTMLADIGRNRTGVAASQHQIAQQKATWEKDVDAQLSDAQKSTQSLKAKVESLRFDLALTELKAPASGKVVGLKANTVGGVITSGQVLLEIVPENGKLIIEADVPTNMIDKVHANMAADLRFSAFNQVTTPVVPGRVALVGADRLPATQPNHPADYYLAQVETTAEALTKLAGKEIQPGMPVEVIVKTGERSFLSYLIKPLADRFARSFKGE